MPSFLFPGAVALTAVGKLKQTRHRIKYCEHPAMNACVSPMSSYSAMMHVCKLLGHCTLLHQLAAGKMGSDYKAQQLPGAAYQIACRCNGTNTCPDEESQTHTLDINDRWYGY